MKGYMKISVLVLFILMSMSVFAQPYSYIDDVQQERWYDGLFGNTFSTSKSVDTPGSINDYEAGDVISKLGFRYYCDENGGDYQRFNFKFYQNGQPITGVTDSYVLTKSCNAKTGYNAIVYNLRIPELDDTYCGQRVQVNIQHEVYANGRWVVDTYMPDTSDGYEKIISIQYECETNVCDGLTGQTVGDTFCRGDDVAILEYSDFVKDNQCFQKTKILENCRGDYSCDDGDCVREVVMIDGYLLNNNQCSVAQYQSDKNKPDNFYVSEDECLSNLQDEEQDNTDVDVDETEFCTTDYIPVCGVNKQTYSNTCVLETFGVELLYAGECVANDDTTDDTTTDDTDTDTDTTDDVVEEELNIFQKFWNWFMGLFRV
jgi:hypothetical protein